MPKPNIFISHRWAYQEDYHSLVEKLELYGLAHHDYSVPQHDPLNVNRKRQIAAALQEQVRQCNYFIIFARLASDSEWCRHEVKVASFYERPILSVRPWNYQGGIPLFIQNADNQGGPFGFNAPPIIRQICDQLSWPVPKGL